MQFGHLARRAPFDDEEILLELLGRMNNFPGISHPPEVIATEAAFPRLSAFAGDPSALEQLKGLLDWFAEQAASTP